MITKAGGYMSGPPFFPLHASYVMSVKTYSYILLVCISMMQCSDMHKDKLCIYPLQGVRFGV